MCLFNLNWFACRIMAVDVLCIWAAHYQSCSAVRVTMSVCVKLIERAGRAADDEKVEQKMAESWEELSLVSASPTLIKKGIKGAVMKHVAKAAKQQKGMCYISATKSVQANETHRNITNTLGVGPHDTISSRDLCHDTIFLRF